jgi:hypothetical protein
MGRLYDIIILMGGHRDPPRHIFYFPGYNALHRIHILFFIPFSDKH